MHHRVCAILAANVVGGAVAASSLAGEVAPLSSALIDLKASVAAPWRWTGSYAGYIRKATRPLEARRDTAWSIP
jgi:hypothetical protein